MSDLIGRSDLISRNDALGVIEEWYCSTHKITKLNELAELLRGDAVYKAIYKLSAVDAVAVDKVAQMFYEFTGDDCPCNYNDNDEWLPEICELREECPYPADRLGCWKQFVKRYGERREDDDQI